VPLPVHDRAVAHRCLCLHAAPAQVYDVYCATQELYARVDARGLRTVMQVDLAHLGRHWAEVVQVGCIHMLGWSNPWSNPCWVGVTHGRAGHRTSKGGSAWLHVRLDE
jgi:hypothetical protein